MKIYVLAYFTFISLSLFGQVNDFGIWTGGSIGKKINSRTDIKVKGQLRFNENVTELGSAYVQTDAEYDLGSGFSAGIAYRFEKKRNTNDFYSTRHRINFNASYKLKTDKLDVSLRERFQTQYTDVNSSKGGRLPENYLRNKLTFDYKLSKRISAYLSGELWYQLNNPSGNDFDNVRYTAGINYELNENNALEFFYLISREFNVKHPACDYVFGILYNFSL